MIIIDAVHKSAYYHYHDDEEVKFSLYLTPSCHETLRTATVYLVTYTCTCICNYFSAKHVNAFTNQLITQADNTKSCFLLFPIVRFFPVFA